MTGIATGFAIVILPILLGYIAGRFTLLGGNPRDVLARLVFFFLSPCLLFSVLSHADVSTLFSTLLPISAIAAVAMFALFAVVSAVFWKRRLGDVVMGSLNAGYVNAANIGIPLASALLGDPALAAPITLVQLLVFMPISFALLERHNAGSISFARIVLTTIRNPMLIGAALGVLVSATDLPVPEIVSLPIDSVAGACIPVMLFSYGLSLHGQRVLTDHEHRRDIIFASVLKLAAMPLVAWFCASVVFQLSAEQVYAVTILAALPTGQNVFNFAQRYRVGEVITRDSIFLTTVLTIPVLLVVALLLAPS